MNSQTDKRPAISYLRISTDMQLKGTGNQRQLEATKAYAKEKNFELINTLDDHGKSGFKGLNIARGSLGDFKKNLTKGLIPKNTVLIVESLDRLSRQEPTTAFTLLSDILRYGIEIHTLIDRQIYTWESINENPSMLFMSIGTMMRAFDESKTKSARMLATWESKRKRIPAGEVLTKVVPSWIEVVSNNDGTRILKLKERDADTIRHIFDLATNENMGSFQITTYLNKNIRKYPKVNANWKSKPNKDWGQSFVVKLLKSKATYGALEIKKSNGIELIEDYYPAVIKKEKFLLAKKCISERALERGRKGDLFPNLFFGLLECGCCSSPIGYKDSGKKGKEYLMCNKRKVLRAGCSNRGWQYDNFQESFLTHIKEINIEDVFSNTEVEERLNDLRMKEASLQVRITTIQSEIDSLIDMSTQPDLNDISKKRFISKINASENTHNELNIELSEVKSELTRLAEFKPSKEHDQLLQQFKKICDLSSSADPEKHEEIKAVRMKFNYLLRRLINKVVIFNDDRNKVLPWEYDRELTAENDSELAEENDGLLTEKSDSALPKEFTDWFWSSRNSKSKYKTLESFLATERGQQELSKFTRYFMVKFKNGNLARVDYRGRMSFNSWKSKLKPKTNS